MLIGELARQTGTTTRTLRYYEQRGLLHSYRDANDYRVYDELAVTRVRNIRRLQANGLSIDDIGYFLGCLDNDLSAEPRCETAIAVYEHRLAELDERMAALSQLRDQMVTELEHLKQRPHQELAPAV